MLNLIRSASLTGYGEVARSCGLDPYQLLAEVGLAAECLYETDLKIPSEKVVLLLEISAQRSGVETFGLRMAETRRASNLGPLMLLVRDEPTLRDALNAMTRYHHLHNEAFFLSVEEEAGMAIIREDLLAGRDIPTRQAKELGLAVLFRLLRFFLGGDWRPQAIYFAHGAPENRSVHARIFGARMEFDQAFTGIVCNARDLKLVLPSADPVMGRYARQYVGSPDAQPGAQLSNEVRQLILLLLPSGRSTIDNIASQIGVTRRTIHRHLAAEDLTFSAILNEVRRELAMRYLERHERPLSEVACLLGFSESSPFSRWFRTTFGCSPRQFRASQEKRRASAGKVMSAKQSGSRC